MSKLCQAVHVAGAFSESLVVVVELLGCAGAGAGAVGVLVDVDGVGVGVVAAVEPLRMLASARSWLSVPWNRFMSVLAWMPAMRLLLEYCQNVHVLHAPAKVVGRLP